MFFITDFQHVSCHSSTLPLIEETLLIGMVVVVLSTAFAVEIRAAFGTRVIQRTTRNHFLQRQLQARNLVAYILLTPSHSRLRRQWFQARAHWRTEWISVVFPGKSRFCLQASDGHMLLSRMSGKRLQTNCL
ncbi:transposable element Tc1 transposase [Trichonephila clavipes]|nr:transposable element Tc1 transposase [Trichonephila clavipes]